MCHTQKNLLTLLHCSFNVHGLILIVVVQIISIFFQNHVVFSMSLHSFSVICFLIISESVTEVTQF